jgi:hypothetical protein
MNTFIHAGIPAGKKIYRPMFFTSGACSIETQQINQAGLPAGIPAGYRPVNRPVYRRVGPPY